MVTSPFLMVKSKFSAILDGTKPPSLMPLPVWLAHAGTQAARRGFSYVNCGVGGTNAAWSKDQRHEKHIIPADELGIMVDIDTFWIILMGLY